MNLQKILRPEAVKLLGSVTSKKRLMRDLADIAEATYGPSGRVCLDALQDRESIGPTGVGNGVALPHARIDTLNEVVGVFLKLQRPLPFEAVDKQPVDLVFALFAPGDAGPKHLKALALVSRALRSEKVRAKLRANDDPAILYSILIDSEQSKAA